MLGSFANWPENLEKIWKLMILIFRRINNGMFNYIPFCLYGTYFSVTHFHIVPLSTKNSEIILPPIRLT